jgi:hypothetical protein
MNTDIDKDIVIVMIDPEDHVGPGGASKRGQILTREMMPALLYFNRILICSKFHLGPRKKVNKKVNRVIT